MIWNGTKFLSFFLSRIFCILDTTEKTNWILTRKTKTKVGFGFQFFLLLLLIGYGPKYVFIKHITSAAVFISYITINNIAKGLWSNQRWRKKSDEKVSFFTTYSTSTEKYINKTDITTTQNQVNPKKKIDGQIHN